MTPEQRKAWSKRYLRKHKAEIRERVWRRRHWGSRWWLKLAFFKAGGSPSDWPIYHERNT